MSMDERLNLREFGPFTLDFRNELLLRGGADNTQVWAAAVEPRAGAAAISAKIAATFLR